MKRKFIINLLIILSLSISVAYGENENIDVNIVEFDIYVNDTRILTEESQYPALSYNNITYFPLTYDYLSALGLSLKFSKSEGLSIIKKESMKNINQKFLGSKNILGTKEKAQKASFKITVNDKIVDNNAEIHPILVYKNITYFPMTWRFAVEEFKWNTSWSRSEGLKIVTVSDKIRRKSEESIVAEEPLVLKVENEFTETENSLRDKFTKADFSGKKFTIDEVSITEPQDKSEMNVSVYVANESLTNILNITIFKREKLAIFLEQLSLELSNDINKPVLVDIRYEDYSYDESTKLDVYNVAQKYISKNEEGNYFISFSIAQFEYNKIEGIKASSFWFDN